MAVGRGVSRPHYLIGGFLPLAARRVLPGRTATAGAALRLADGCCAWLVTIGKGKGEGRSGEGRALVLFFPTSSPSPFPPLPLAETVAGQNF